MDYTISGSGTLPAGEYEAIKINGSAKTEGLVRCRLFRVSGAIKGDTVVRCESEFSAAGSVHLAEVTANTLKTAGSLHLDRAVVEGGKFAVSGSAHVKETLKATCINVAGYMQTGGDVESEDMRVSGRMEIGGAINAGVLDARLAKGDPSTVASIVGGRVRVRPEAVTGFLHRVMQVFSPSRQWLCLEVAGDVEADEIDLIATRAGTVTGQNVVIGDGCEIERVRYSGTVTVSPKAKVASCEKI